jgi:uncharacterized protein YxjI
MALPPPPAGYVRLVMKSKFGGGRDFVVTDPETEQELYYVDGAAISVKPKAEVKRGGKDGEVLYRTTGAVLSIPKHMTITTPDGTEVASLKAKAFSMIKDKMTLTVHGEAEPWTLEGSFIEKNYTVMRGDEHVLQITQKWVTIRDSYTLDVREGIDPALALAIVWAVDRWVEKD